MATVVTFRVPVDACSVLVPGYGTPAVDGLSVKAALKEVIGQALSAGVEPAAVEIPPSTQTERINLSLKDAEAKQVRAIAKAHGIPDSIACQQLIMGYLQSAPGSVADIVPAGCELLQEAWAKSKTGKTPRVAQAQVFLNLRDAFADGQVALVEAATGVGKTMAMLLAAEERLRTIPDSRVVIAVPTIAIMRQFATTHRDLEQSGMDIHPFATLFGRREFVSREALLDVLDNPKYVDYRTAIGAWIKLNGEAMPDAPFDSAWLVSTLRQIAPGFPVEACVLPDVPADDDPGFLAYQRQFAHAERDTQEILLCTHAMLSISTRQRHWGAVRHESYQALKRQELELMLAIKDEKDAATKTQMRQRLQELQGERLLHGAELTDMLGKLPPFRYLMVDEAHQLEAAMSAANASYLSIHSLVQKVTACHAAGLGITAAKLAAAKAAVQRLKGAANHATGDDVTLTDSGAAAVVAREALVELLDACTVGRARKKQLTAGERHLHQQLLYACAVLKSACTARNQNTQASVRFSPVREFPQVYVGTSRVDGLLSSLWAGVKAAACVSATLYVPKAEGYSSNYSRRLLSIPDGRFKDYAPVTPLWLYESVIGVGMPPTTSALAPPSRSDRLTPTDQEAAEGRWLAGVAEAVVRIHETAAGGVLVLMTSYDAIRKLSKVFRAGLHAQAVFASLDVSLAEQSIAFLKLSRAGAKPIWFATGGAWTGLDIGGHEPYRDLLGEAMLPAAEDHVVTDLVIPRLPFGINRTVTHEFRVKTDPRTPWEVLDMLSRFKQGIGRLVRRAGLPANRRIFLLDSRIHGPKLAHVGQRVAEVLRPYRRLPSD